MADGTHLAKIEGDLVPMENEFRADKEQHQLFQDRMESQLAKLLGLFQSKGSSHDDDANHIEHSPPRSSSSGVHSNGSSSTFQHNFRHDLPQFNGDDVEDWLFRLEEFFDVAGTPFDQRIKVASFHMVGPAYAWYNWLIRNDYTQDWVVFANAVCKRFGTDLYDNPQDALKELKQTDSIADYQHQSELLSNKVTGLSEPWLISFFIAGLTDYLKCQLWLAKPATYPEAVAMARLHEQNYLVLRNSLQPSFSLPLSRPRLPGPPPFFSLVPTQVPSTSVKPPTLNTPSTVHYSPSSGAPSKPPFKTFTVAELCERRRQGLCYYFDERYNPSHNCCSQCHILLALEDFAEVCQVSVGEDSQNTVDHICSPEVSFHALSGDYNPRTLRLKDSLRGSLLNILVDSRSTFNFINPRVAQHLALPSVSITPFKVFVGSGDFLWCNTMSIAISIIVQGTSFEIDLYHLEVTGADLVFGLAWLQSFGCVLTDYNLLTMEFIMGFPSLYRLSIYSMSTPLMAAICTKCFSMRTSSLCVICKFFMRTSRLLIPRCQQTSNACWSNSRRFFKSPGAFHPCMILPIRLNCCRDQSLCMLNRTNTRIFKRERSSY